MASKHQLSPNEELALIRGKLGHLTLQSTNRVYLDTGYEDLNATLGHPKRGLRYGKLLELSGENSHGKSVISYLLAGMFQRDGAEVLWLDPETSWDYSWAKIWLPRPKDVCLIQPYVGEFEKKKKKGTERLVKRTPWKKGDKIRPGARLAYAEELCAEAEAMTDLWYRRALESDTTPKMVMVVDSLTAFMVKDEGEAGTEGQNMNTNAALARFLSKFMRRWAGHAQTHNCYTIFINQLRTTPGVAFGDPTYTPGGKAAKFYCHSRVKVRRIKGGRMKLSGKTVGLKGLMTNFKNKLGGTEGTEVGYKIRFVGKYNFVSAGEMKKEEKE
jgi:RecA/RadA recombinase